MDHNFLFDIFSDISVSDDFSWKRLSDPDGGEISTTPFDINCRTSLNSSQSEILENEKNNNIMVVDDEGGEISTTPNSPPEFSPAVLLLERKDRKTRGKNITYENMKEKESNKKKGRDLTPIESFIDIAVKENDCQRTGIICYTFYYVICETIFCDYINSKRYELGSKKISRGSIFQKLDKSRYSNQVDHEKQSGRFEIKFLRIDDKRRNKVVLSPEQEEHLKEVKHRHISQYNWTDIRIITNRQQGYLPTSYFYHQKGGK
jgi:hypothetical protein